MTYLIWEGFLDELAKKMRTVEKKCRKYGVEFTYRLTGNDEYRDVKDSDGETHKLRYVEVEADGKAEINGWRWLARIERTENGNLIHSANDVTVPTKYYDSDCYCEHCRKNVWRRDLYLVQNTDSGEIKQVGRNCLRDYTHGMSADAIAYYASLFTGLEEMESEAPSGMGGFFRDYDYYDVEEVTRFVCETIRLFGFVPRNEDGKVTTASRVHDFYDVAHDRRGRFARCPDVFYRLKNEMETVGFNADSSSSTAEARKALDWIAAQDDSKSAYIHNLKVVVSMKEVKDCHFGILASLIPTWNKDVVREAKRKAEAAAESHSEYVGKEGDRMTFEVAKTKIITSWETDYGVMWLVKFVTVDGNVLMWRSSSVHNLPDDLETIRKVTGTVKGHEEFRGTKQTFINRCKVTETIGDAKEPEHAPYNDSAEKAIDDFLKYCEEA